MSNGAVMKYNMDSKVWTNVTPSTGRSWSGIAVDLNSPNKVVTTTYNFWSSEQPWGWGDEVYYSSNGGATWTNKTRKGGCTMENNGIGWMQGRSLHWAGCATMSHAKPGWVFVVSGNGIFATENIAAASPVWKVVSHGLEETVPVNVGMLSVLNGPFISSVGDQGGFVHTDISKYPSATIPQTIAMTYAPLAPANIVRSVNTTQTINGASVKTSVVHLSDNSGISWVTLPFLPVAIENGTTSISADGKIILWKGSNSTLGTKHYWTTDRGVTWNLGTLTLNATPVCDAVDPLKFYVMDTSLGYICVSTDGGKTFKAKTYLGLGNSVLKNVIGHEGHIWVNNSGKIKYSTDGGLTFTNTTNYSCVAFALGKEAPGTDYPTIYMWGKNTSTAPEAMYRSIDKGQTWIRANDDLHQWGSLANAGNIEADKNVYGRVYKSTAGMGIPWMGIEGYTAVDNLTDYKVTVEIFPTVFSNSCTLKSKNRNIKQISIYNLQGALVESISTDLYNNESVEIGNKLQKGIYLVQVTDNVSSSTYKIVKK
jgi:hypothetical protein